MRHPLLFVAAAILPPMLACTGLGGSSIQDFQPVLDKDKAVKLLEADGWQLTCGDEAKPEDMTGAYSCVGAKGDLDLWLDIEFLPPGDLRKWEMDEVVESGGLLAGVVMVHDRPQTQAVLDVLFPDAAELTPFLDQDTKALQAHTRARMEAAGWQVGKDESLPPRDLYTKDGLTAYLDVKVETYTFDKDSVFQAKDWAPSKSVTDGSPAGRRRTYDGRRQFVSELAAVASVGRKDGDAQTSAKVELSVLRVDEQARLSKLVGKQALSDSYTWAPDDL